MLKILTAYQQFLIKARFLDLTFLISILAEKQLTYNSHSIGFTAIFSNVQSSEVFQISHHFFLINLEVFDLHFLSIRF